MTSAIDIRFNPYEVADQPGYFFFELADRNAIFARPDGEFFWLLARDIKRRFQARPEPQYAIKRYQDDALSTLLFVAVRSRVLTDESSRGLEKLLRPWRFKGLIKYWELELFRRVATLAAAIDADTPSILRDEKAAWSIAFLREVDIGRTDTMTTKIDSAKALKAFHAAIEKEINPFPEDGLQPERRALIDWAIRLGKLNPDDRFLSNANDIKSLRKAVRDALSSYGKAHKALASHLSPSSPDLIATTVQRGRLYALGKKGHMTLIQDTENISKNGGDPYRS